MREKFEKAKKEKNELIIKRMKNYVLREEAKKNEAKIGDNQTLIYYK